MTNAIDVVVREFISHRFLDGRDASQLSREESLVERGILDSAGMLELVNLVEEEFPIKIADHELVPDNWSSITNLVRFIETKLDDLGKLS